MLIRIIAVDPEPRDEHKVAESDLLTYHVPEHSRHAELLLELLANARIEHVVLDTNNKVFKRKYPRRRKR